MAASRISDGPADAPEQCGSLQRAAELGASSSCSQIGDRGFLAIKTRLSPILHEDSGSIAYVAPVDGETLSFPVSSHSIPPRSHPHRPAPRVCSLPRTILAEPSNELVS